MCKHIEKLQTFCLDRELNVRPGLDAWSGLKVQCGECDIEVELEGIGPDYPIAPVEEFADDVEDPE